MGIEKLPSGREGKGELETCPRCSGTGKAYGNDKCGRCSGTGKDTRARARAGKFLGPASVTQSLRTRPGIWW